MFLLNFDSQDKRWAAAKAPRHLLMDARGWETCRYMWELSMPFRLAHRINIELNGLMEELSIKINQNQSKRNFSDLFGVLV